MSQHIPSTIEDSVHTADAVRCLVADAVARASVRADVGFEDLHVAFFSNFQPALEWVDEYLGEYLTVDKLTTPEPAVGAFVDPSLHASLLSLLAPAAGESFATHRSSDSRDGSRWRWKTCRSHQIASDLLIHVYDEDGGITISDGFSRVYSFVSAGSTRDATYEPVRLIRELLILGLEMRGVVPLHAGAVAVDGSGVLVCGPRGAGKTSLICSLIEHANAEFVANDRLFVSSDEERPRAISFPWGIRIALDTCAESAAMSSWLRPDRKLRYPQAGWPLAPLAPLFDSGSRSEIAKVELTAAELAGAMGCGVLASVPIDLVVYPRFDRDGPELSVERACPKSTVLDLIREVDHVATDVYRDWLSLGLRSRGLVSAEYRGSMMQLATDVPAVRIRYRDSEPAAAAVAALLGSDCLA